MTSKVVPMDIFSSGALEDRIKKLEEWCLTMERSRRGTYARFSEIDLLMMEQNKRLDLISEEVYKNG